MRKRYLRSVVLSGSLFVVLVLAQIFIAVV